MQVCDVGKTLRLKRIFRNGRALIVPIDDSLISGPELGLRNIRETISNVVNSNATAMMMTYGSFVRNYDVIGNFPCILNVTGSTTLSNHTNKVKIHSVENAIKCGFVGIAVHINVSSKYESNMLQTISEIVVDCAKFSMPLMIIAYPRTEKDGKDYNYKDIDIDDYACLIRHCTRLAVELGADFIKTHYTGTVESFKTVVDSAEGVPVLISGQSLIDETTVIRCTEEVLTAGGSGVCFGRNIYNRDNTKDFISDLSRVVFKI